MNRFKVSLETRRGGSLKGIFKFGDKRLDVLSTSEIFVNCDIVNFDLGMEIVWECCNELWLWKKFKN